VEENMQKNVPIVRKFLMSSLGLVAALLFFSGTSFAVQAVISDDTYTVAGQSTKNFGTKKVIIVEAGKIGYVKFNLSTLPAGLTGADIEKATLTLFVAKVKTAGSMDIYQINPAAVPWTEKDLTSGSAPGSAPLDGLITTVFLDSSQGNTFVSADVTGTVKAWMDGAQNNGFALAPPSSISAQFVSKEGFDRSHQAT
jgi:hypothetical protein